MTPPPPTIERTGQQRVVVVDRVRGHRDALVHAVEAAPHLEPVAMVSTLARAATDRIDGPVDAVLIQVAVPGMNVLREVLLARERFASTRVLVISGYVDHYLVEQLTECGASAVVSTDVPLAEVFEILVSAGPVGDEHGSAARHHLAAELADDLGVTSRELEVLHFLSEGHSPQQIARDLGTTVGTVRGHLKSLRLKLACSNAVQLIVSSHRLGILPNLGRPLR